MVFLSGSGEGDVDKETGEWKNEIVRKCVNGSG